MLLAASAVGAAAVWVPALLPSYETAAVVSGSMRPVVSEGDLVIFRSFPPPDRRASSDLGLAPGDIVLFLSPRDGTTRIMHRVVSVTDDGRVKTKGDANPVADDWLVDPGDVKGVARLVIPRAGMLAYLRTSNQPAPLVLLLAVALAISVLSARPRLPRHLR